MDERNLDSFKKLLDRLDSTEKSELILEMLYLMEKYPSKIVLTLVCNLNGNLSNYNLSQVEILGPYNNKKHLLRELNPALKELNDMQKSFFKWDEFFNSLAAEFNNFIVTDECGKIWLVKGLAN